MLHLPQQQVLAISSARSSGNTYDGTTCADIKSSNKILIIADKLNMKKEAEPKDHDVLKLLDGGHGSSSGGALYCLHRSRGARVLTKKFGIISWLSRLFVCFLKSQMFLFLLSPSTLLVSADPVFNHDAGTTDNLVLDHNDIIMVSA